MPGRLPLGVEEWSRRKEGCKGSGKTPEMAVLDVRAPLQDFRHVRSSRHLDCRLLRRAHRSSPRPYAEACPTRSLRDSRLCGDLRSGYLADNAGRGASAAESDFEPYRTSRYCSQLLIIPHISDGWPSAEPLRQSEYPSDGSARGSCWKLTFHARHRPERDPGGVLLSHCRNCLRRAVT